MNHQQVIVQQPSWLESWLHHQTTPKNDKERLTEVLALAEENIERQSGGPFAAAVYDQISGERLAATVNTVVRNCTALAHAEIIALALAQQRLKQFSLHYKGGPSALLVTSSAPCTMCLGAIAWSGIDRLIYCTSRKDVESIGFDEGPATPRWRSELTRRDIQVQGPRLHKRGKALLQRYLAQQGILYNGKV